MKMCEWRSSETSLRVQFIYHDESGYKEVERALKLLNGKVEKMLSDLIEQKITELFKKGELNGQCETL